MPTVQFPCQSITNTVMRPVILDISRQILKLTGLPENIKVFFPGEFESDLQLDSAIQKNGDEVKFPGHDRLTVEVDEEMTPSLIGTNAIRRPEHPFFFYDTDSHLYIKPGYAFKNITINVKYKATDQEKARRWKDDIAARSAELRSVFLHDVRYRFEIPMEIMFIMYEVYTRREAIASYAETFDQYITRYLAERGSVESSLDGDNRRLVISENQIGIQGYFDFDAEPEKGGPEGEADGWTINFSYKFMYSKIVECVTTYPIIVHNQLLPEGYIVEENDNKNLIDRPAIRSESMTAFHFFEAKRHDVQSGQNCGYALPEFDKFIPKTTLKGTFRVFTALTTISEADKRSLFSFTDLGDLEIEPKMLELIRSEGSYMLEPYRSVFNLSLYEEADQQPSTALVIDGLDVKAASDLNLRKTYRVRFSFIADWSLLPSAVIDRLRNNGAIALDFVKLIQGDDSVKTVVDGEKYLLEPSKAVINMYNNQITKQDMPKIISALRGEMSRPFIKFATVQTFFIQAMR